PPTLPPPPPTPFPYTTLFRSWYTGAAVWPAGELLVGLHGACVDLIVSPIEPALLTPSDRELLLGSAARSREASERAAWAEWAAADRKSTRLNSSHVASSYAVF